MIMDFDLPADVPLPATLKFAIPSGASIAGMAEIDPNGNFIHYNSIRRCSRGPTGTSPPSKCRNTGHCRSTTTTTLVFPRERVRVRSPCCYNCPLDATSLNLHVQQPARATDFAVTPALQATGAAQDGFTYAVAAFSDVKAGSTFGYVVSYDKPDAQLSVSSSGTTTGAKLNTTTVLLAVIAALVVVFGSVIIFYLYRKGGKPAPSKGQQRAKTPPGRATAAPRNAQAKKPAARVADVVNEQREASAAHCPSCGEELAKKARFCPNCGLAVAKEPADGPKTSDQTAPGQCPSCGEDLVKKTGFCPSCGEAQGQ